MRIHSGMSLVELGERMGDDTAPEEAAAMRDLLLNSGYDDTDSIPSVKWFEMLDEVA